MNEVTSALAKSPALIHLQESLRQATLTPLPQFEMPKLINQETLSAISNAYDTSTITSALASAETFRRFSAVVGAYLADCSPSQFTPDQTGLTLEALFTDVQQASQLAVARLDGQSTAVEGAAHNTATEIDPRTIAASAAVLLVLVAAAAYRAAPASYEAIEWFSHHLLEDGIFISKSTHTAYVELSNALPDDNVLGWVAALAWVLRKLRKISSTDETGMDT